MDMLLYAFLLLSPTVAAFTILKAVEIIVNKDERYNWKIYAFVSGVCLTLAYLAVAYF